MDAELPVALVTGAGRAGGLGPSIARALAADGYRVVVHFHSSGADADRLAANSAGWHWADLSDRPSQLNDGARATTFRSSTSW